MKDLFNKNCLELERILIFFVIKKRTFVKEVQLNQLL